MISRYSEGLSECPSLSLSLFKFNQPKKPFKIEVVFILEVRNTSVHVLTVSPIIIARPVVSIPTSEFNVSQEN